MSKKGKSNKAAVAQADQARVDETIRQGKIIAGTDQINRIFGGGAYGKDAVDPNAAYDPSHTYYNADGSVWTPPAPTAAAAPAPVSPGAMSFVAARAAAQNPAGSGSGNQFSSLAKSGKLFSSAGRGGFGDDFFKQQRDNYINYATPQLQDQYGKAQKQLAFSLDRAGVNDSSIRSSQEGELQKLYDKNLQQVNDQALSYETNSRNSVEDARANLIQTLNATGDAQGAANSAISRATALSQPQAYSPIANLFSDFTSGLGIQAAQEKAAALSGGAYVPRYNTGLFGTNPSAVVTS